MKLCIMPKRISINFYYFLIPFLLNSCIIPFGEDIFDFNDIILDEDFTDNKIGWIEENSNIHELKIKNGCYFIYSKDTSYSYTSTSPLDKSFLYGLNKFELQISFLLAQKSPKSTHFGVFFESGVLRYDFIYDAIGRAYLSETNYSNNDSRDIASLDINILDLSKPIVFKIFVFGNKYYYYVNNYVVGKGKLNSSSWQDIRLLVSSGTDLMVNSFKIKKRIDE